MVQLGAVAVIFSSTRAAGGDEEYAAAADAMDALAQNQPGFVGIESVRDPGDRRGITVSYWADEHLVAQQRGREEWYSEYSVVVAEVTRTYRHPR
jgi:heme-degrading monooxygenase HmoA